MDDVRQHLQEAHGRWCADLVGLQESSLEALHELDHYEAALGLPLQAHSHRHEHSDLPSTVLGAPAVR